MKTKRTHALCVAVGCAVLFVVPSEGKEKADARDSDRAESWERVEMANLVLVKRFCVALRRNDTEKLRAMIDPRYLEKHAEAKVVGAPVLGIHNIAVGGDGGTVLSLYETNESKKEAMIFRTAEFEGAFYIVPPQAPDTATGEFLPWVLRTELERFAAL